MTLAAVNPFQIWYSQEVRTPPALLCLWGAARLRPADGTRLTLVDGIRIAAAAGLYTLYWHFAFWLMPQSWRLLVLLGAADQAVDRPLCRLAHAGCDAHCSCAINCHRARQDRPTGAALACTVAERRRSWPLVPARR